MAENNQKNYWTSIKIDGDERPIMDVEARNIIDENNVFLDSVNATIDLGGIQKGTSLKDVPIKSILKNLLCPYSPFNIVSFTTTQSSGYYEKGTNVKVTSANVNLSSGSSPIRSISIITDTNEIIIKKTENINEDGANLLTFTLPKTFTTNGYVKAIVEDENNTIKNMLSSFTFISPYYYGAINSDEIVTSILIKNLTKSVTPKGTKTFTITMNQQKAVFAYPVEYGEISLILDENNFNVTDTFEKTTLKILDVDYYVYVLDKPVTSTMKFKFSY